LPPKQTLGNTERDFVARRKRKLEAYLAALLAHPVYGESHELRAFLQALPDGDSAAAIAAGGSSSSSSSSSSSGGSGGGGAANPGRLGSAATVLPRRLGEGREWTPLREGVGDGVGDADGGGAAAGAAAALAAGMGVENLQSGRQSQVPTTPWVSAEDPRAMDDVSLQRIQSRAYAILKEVCC
jgi:hypothetical protein